MQMPEMSVGGFDPFDALHGRNVPAWVRNRSKTRQILIQLRKRLPIDLTRLIGIEPFVMAKTVGVMLTSAVREGAESRRLLTDLFASKGSLGEGAWGYEFDVQTRWAFYPTGSPNLIATVFVARGLGTAGVVLADDDTFSQFTQSAEFLDSNLFVDDENPYFRYTLASDRLVHNANLLGAGLCAMAGVMGGHGELVDRCVRCAKTSIRAQRENGSWPYGVGESLDWSDSFHTAYNLDGLLQVWLSSGDVEVRQSLKRGVDHWVSDFFGPDGEPRYFLHKAYPYDIHSAGTAVDVAARLATWGFGTRELCERVASWTARNLIDSSTGVTYYQKHRFWTDKRHFVRWGDAHWALGRSSLALLREGRRDPLEVAVWDAREAASHAR